MSSRKDWVTDVIADVVGSEVTAKLVVERLMEEGVLHLGYGNADIDIVVEKFKETFGTTKVTRQDRWAANRLVSKNGSQAVVGVIQLLGGMMDQQYAPVVGSITQLEDKWVNVLNFLRTKSNNATEIVE